MDTIKISQITLSTRIGTLAWEQKVNQELKLDLEYGTDAAGMTLNDKLDNRYNYADVTQAIVEFVAVKHTQLIETLANDIANLCLEQLNLEWLRLTLHKPGALAQATNVSITIERTKQRGE